jgi:hypothetical protein
MHADERHRFPTRTVSVVILLMLYAAPYTYYRLVADHSSTLYIGGYVQRPWLTRGHIPSQPDFTFSDHSRSMGLMILNSSQVPYDAVGWLSKKTGRDLATPANYLWYPLARIDHLFTGRYLHFFDTYGPTFSFRSLAPPPPHSSAPWAPTELLDPFAPSKSATDGTEKEDQP